MSSYSNHPYSSNMVATTESNPETNHLGSATITITMSDAQEMVTFWAQRYRDVKAELDVLKVGRCRKINIMAGKVPV